MRKKFIVGCLALAFVAASQGSVIYVSENGAGANDGSSAGNAHSRAWWNANNGAVAAGSTVHLVGTLTNGIGQACSGTAGNPIVFVGDAGAKLSAPALADNGIWWYFDGVHDCVYSNLWVELTDNGTPVAQGGTHTYSRAVKGFYAAFSGANNLTFVNLTMTNLYQRQGISNSPPSSGGLDLAGSGISFVGCKFDGIQEVISKSYSSVTSSNLTLLNCILTNFNHGITVGAGPQAGAPSMLNVSIHGCHLECGDMFESADLVELGLHRNPIFFFNESGHGGSISNIDISGNFISSGASPRSHTAGTAAIFFDGYSSSFFQHVRVHDNISVLAPQVGWSGGGGHISGGGTDVLVYNNTCVGWQTNGVWHGNGISIAGTNCYQFNNLVIGAYGATFGTWSATSGVTNNDTTKAALLSGLWSDYNAYNFLGANSFETVIFQDNSSTTWTQALADGVSGIRAIYSGLLAAHFEPHSITNAITIDASYHPDATAVAGTNLFASLGPSVDFAGNLRPSSGPWTIGALEFSGGGGGGTGGGSTGGSTTGGSGGMSGGGMISVTNVLSLQKGVKVKGKVKFKLAN